MLLMESAHYREHTERGPEEHNCDNHIKLLELEVTLFPIIYASISDFIV